MVVHHEYVSCQYRDWVSHEGAGKGCISSLEGSRFRASAAWLPVTMNQEHTIELAYVHVVALLVRARSAPNLDENPPHSIYKQRRIRRVPD